MRHLVLFESERASEFLSAVFALKRFNLAVSSLVRLQVGDLAEGVTANAAFVRLLACKCIVTSLLRCDTDNNSYFVMSLFEVNADNQ